MISTTKQILLSLEMLLLILEIIFGMDFIWMGITMVEIFMRIIFNVVARYFVNYYNTTISADNFNVTARGFGNYGNINTDSFY